MLTHSPRIVTDGLVLCLDAGNRESYPGSGTTWTDLAGNNNGTLTNGPTFSSANGGSIVFDGSDDYVTIEETSNMRPNVLTAEVVFRCVSTTNTSSGGNPGTSQYILFRQNTRTSNFEGYQIRYLEATQAIGAEATPSNGAQNLIISSASSALLGNIVYATASFDTTTTSIYINGVFNTSGLKGSGIDYNNTHTLKIGRAVAIGNSWDSAFNGNIYSVRIYNRALSPAEVLQNYNATKGRFNL